MPDYRTHTQVGARSDLDFNKRPDPLWKSRRKWIVLCGLLGLWPLVWQLSSLSESRPSGDQTIYWSHTLSTSHQIVQHDCQACHREWFQTIRMNFTSPGEKRVIEANTCQTCHWEDTRDHNPHLVTEQAQGCFRCHAEHRHKASLNEVADVFCVGCHQNLQRETEDGIVPSPFFVTEISSWDAHPEFALRRPIDPETAGQLAGKAPGEIVHQVHTRAKRELRVLENGETAWQWEDQANVRFNHARHLQPLGIGIPVNHPLNEERKKNGLDPVVTKVLNCADCHLVDPNGEYFQPINYERHCADCHELSFSRVLNQVDVAKTNPLPHESPEIIRGTLRDRLTTYLANYLEANDGKFPSEQGSPFSPLPRKADENVLPPTAQQKAEWVDSQLKQVETAVLGTDQSLNYDKFMRGCQHCHFVEANQKTQGVNWNVVPPKIPERWLPHSRFRHDRHDMLECFDCHYNRPPDDPENADPRSDAGSIYFSKTARDVLMPSIDKCRTCHGTPVPTPFPGRVRARADCIECHRYHHTMQISPPTRDLWDRRDGIHDVTDRLWRQREVPQSRDQWLRESNTTLGERGASAPR